MALAGTTVGGYLGYPRGTQKTECLTLQLELLSKPSNSGCTERDGTALAPPRVETRPSPLKIIRILGQIAVKSYQRLAGEFLNMI